MGYLIKILAIFLLAASAYSQELDRISVIVNDGVVLESDIQSRISDYKKNAAIDGLSIPPEDVLRELIIDQLIIEELQLQIADRVGIKISDEELNMTIKSLAQQNDLSLEDFIKFVEERGDSYAQLREQVRKNLKIRRVQQGSIQNKISISSEEVENFLKTEEALNQLGPELNVKQVLIRKGSVQDINEIYSEIKLGISDGINFNVFIEKYSEDDNDGDLGWRKITGFPELFKEPINNLLIGDISEPIESGAGMHILYLENKRGPTVTFEKQWNVRHILLIPNTIRTEADSEEKIIQIRDQILNGASFAELAAEFSDDPGSKQEGGNLGWAGDGVYAPEFEQAIKNANLNEITKPFLTQFGWHILEVLDTRIEDKTNERIEDQAFSYLFNRKFDEELESHLQELRAEAFIEIKEFD
tara:strand:+ start:1937 stop:3184 length:1248 start_codon:yes stop_codon:yes gene_type:complete